MLISKRYFEDKDITLMTDLNIHEKSYTSTKNIIEHFDKLLDFAHESNDKTFIFISFSCHSIGITGSGDTKPNINQALVTSDGILSKYDFFDNFINKLPPTTSVVVLIDSYSKYPFCELKYMYTCDNMNRYTIKNNNYDTQCVGLILTSCIYNDYLMGLLEDINQESPKLDDNEKNIIEAFLNVCHENITIKNLVIGIHQWFQKNNSKQILYIYGSKLVDINKLSMCRLLNNLSKIDY